MLTSTTQCQQQSASHHVKFATTENFFAFAASLPSPPSPAGGPTTQPSTFVARDSSLDAHNSPRRLLLTETLKKGFRCLNSLFLFLPDPFFKILVKGKTKGCGRPPLKLPLITENPTSFVRIESFSETVAILLKDGLHCC